MIFFNNLSLYLHLNKFLCNLNSSEKHIWSHFCAKKSLNDALIAITFVSDFYRFFIYYIDFPNSENVYNDMFVNRKSKKQVNREIDCYHQKSLLNF